MIMKKNIMQIHIIVLGSFWSVIQLSAGLSTTSTLSVTKGEDITFVCDVAGTFTLPGWLGPPDSIIYANQDSSTLNPSIVAYNRLTYNSNNKDLDLNTVTDSDAGIYQCTTTNGDHTITLVVTEPTTTTTTTTTTPASPNDGLGTGAIVGIIIAVLVVAGITLAIIVYVVCKQTGRKGKTDAESKPVKSTGGETKQLKSNSA